MGIKNKHKTNKIIRKKHIHKWVKDFQDCSFCGGGEIRYCKKENCFATSGRQGNKWIND